MAEPVPIPTRPRFQAKKARVARTAGRDPNYVCLKKRAGYRTWQSILTRCTNRNFHAWGRYGGRGITVCDRWRGPGGFINFLADMGERPSAKHEIDRIDNDGGYCPENCRWVTRKEQARNRRTNHRLTVKGETLCITEWSARTGVKKTTILRRLQWGWSPEDAVFRPARKRKEKSS